MTVTYRPATADDRGVLERLLAGLTPQSAYSRFQAAPGPALPPALVDALLPQGVSGGALLGWDGDVPVAHGVWVRVGASRTAEIALVVTDSHQRLGIGTALAERLLTAAGARGIERIEVFSESHNRAVARMVARRSPGAERDRDRATVTYSFAIGELAQVGAAPRGRKVA